VEYAGAALFSVSGRDVEVAEFRVVPPLQSVDAGGRVQFAAELVLSNGTRVPVTDRVHWISLDGSIAQTTRVPGEFIGLRAGTTQVRASLSALGAEQTSSAQLRVVSPDVVTEIEIDPASPVMTVGGHRQLHASLLLSNGESIDVTDRGSWSSSNPAVS